MFNISNIAIKIDFSKRPAFKWLIENASKNIYDTIVFYKWDRFSRNSIFSKISKIYFSRYNIRLIPSDDSIEPLMIDIKGSLGEEEIRKMKERVRLVRQNRFEKGDMTAKAPVGYRLNKDTKKMQIDKVKAKIVLKAFEMTADAYSYKGICKELKLKPQSYYNIVRNKVYMGIIEFEGKERKGNHPSIITEELFYQCNPHLGKT